MPLFAEHTVGIAIFGYDGLVTIGVSADRHSVPDVGVLAAGIERAFAELLEHAAAPA